MGRVSVTEVDTKKLLTRTGGFLNGYDYTINPYIGCVFGCSYCYVRALPVAKFHEGEWGSYVDVKKNRDDALDHELMLARRRGDVNIFMSSSTDPYQPMEARYRIARSVIDALLRHPENLDFLFIQTRSPLVADDTDRIRSLGDKSIVSMTIETDLEEVRRRFSPAAPPLHLRLRALEQLRRAGVRTQVAVAPALPFSDQFGRLIAEVAQDVVIDDLFTGDGANGRRSRSFRLESKYTKEERHQWWDGEPLMTAYDKIAQHLPRDHIFSSKVGFLPPGLRRRYQVEETTERKDPDA